MMIAQLPTPLVVQWWPSIEQQMLSAPQVLGGLPTEYFIAQAMANLMQVWVLVGDDNQVRVTIFTEIREESRGRVLRFVAAWGSEFEGFFRLFPQTLEDLKTRYQIDLIEVEGRAGWTRLLAKIGFKVDRVILTKYLERTVH